MTYVENRVDIMDVETMLDNIIASDQQQSNCMFQLSVMLARIALEPVSENYKDDMAQALLGLIRTKPKSNVVHMFGAIRSTQGEAPRMRALA